MTNSTDDRLESLQERYPHGSQWRQQAEWLGKMEERRFRVVGFDGDGVVVANCGPDNKSGYTLWNPDCLDRDCERVPDPPPCPITEPVTLRWTPFSGGAEWTSGDRYTPQRDVPSITLHPPGTPISQIDGEFGFYTWGET